MDLGFWSYCQILTLNDLIEITVKSQRREFNPIFLFSFLYRSSRISCIVFILFSSYTIGTDIFGSCYVRMREPSLNYNRVRGCFMPDRDPPTSWTAQYLVAEHSNPRQVTHEQLKLFFCVLPTYRSMPVNNSLAVSIGFALNVVLLIIPTRFRHNATCNMHDHSTLQT